MTRKQYLKLVRSSTAFRNMDRGTQDHILSSRGEDMEAYAKIFAEEERQILKANKKFITTTVEVIDGLEKNVKVIIKVERKKAEAKSDKEEKKVAQKLLEEINEL